MCLRVLFTLWLRPLGVKQAILALRHVDTELHERANTVHGVKDLVIPQYRDVQSGYFNELFQYDHMKICPFDNNITGILVIIVHFSK